MSEEPVVPPVEDPEPDGVVEAEVAPGKKERVVSVSTLAAERKRIREAEAAKHAKELEPLKQVEQQFKQLQTDVEAWRGEIEFLRAHPEIRKQHEPPELQQVPDDEAERYARDYELYTPHGLDLPKAKRIIARNREETKRIAAEVAREAAQPAIQASAAQASRQNFLWAASQKGSDGRPLVDPKILAEEWSQLPHEHTADQRVAELLLDRAIGKQMRSGRQPPPAPTHEPVFTEPPGGRAAAYQISDLERKVARNTGVSEADWQKTAAKYQPDRVNVLGD